MMPIVDEALTYATYLITTARTNTTTNITGGTTVGTNSIWVRWQTDCTHATGSWPVHVDNSWDQWSSHAAVTNEARLRAAQAAPRISVEQVQANQRAAEQAHREHLARIAAETKARERAEKLLRESLAPNQREQLAQKGYFELSTIAPTGERRIYRIRRGRSANIDRVDESGRVLHRLCAHPIELVPDADTMLAQKLWLENCEPEFLAMANVHPAR
jgi:hypothetical protein